ncbi:hypothetical protein SB444474_5325 [Shigella boydii 4444-74]|uniref:Uncharacterized protein n=1 Tax=Shigella boydii 4444-74 TaxID=766140 RepID=I6FB74_SHIBO|nr:hypothetical protein SB444474_5325 [Shigella boydii 4444-74]
MLATFAKRLRISSSSPALSNGAAWACVLINISNTDKQG